MKKSNLILTGILLGLSTSAMAFLSMDRSTVSLPMSRHDDSIQPEDIVAPPTAKFAKRNISSGLYAYSIASATSIDEGLYHTDLDGSMSLVWNAPSDGWHMFNGWMYDGRLTGFRQHLVDGVYDGITLTEQDFETGEILDSKSLDPKDYNTWFTHCDYIPQKEVIFGLGRDEKNWDSMKTMNINDLSDIKNLCTVYYDYLLLALAYNPYDENVYAITRKKQFVRINQETGEYDYLWDIPLPDMNTNYKMALTYLPNADEYLFATTLNDIDMTTVYYRLDVESQIIAQTAQITDSHLVTFFVNTDEKDMQSPLRPEFTGMEFPYGGLSGAFTFTMSNETAGGNAITESLNWTFYADGEAISSGSAAPGASVSVDVQLTEGEHTIEMASAVGDHAGPSFKKVVYIGNDTPKAPTNVVLEEGKVSWDAVTEGVHNGYLNLAEMTYEIYINDEYIGETSETYFNFSVAPTDAFGKHVASVIAICNDLESEKAMSNSTVYGAPMNLDVFFTPSRDEAQLFTVVKDDIDRALSWGYDVWDSAFATDYPWVKSTTWLVTPPLNMDDTKIVYSVEFEAMANKLSNDGEAYLRVYLGESKDPTDGDRILIDHFIPTIGQYSKYRAIFCIHEPKNGHIGFQASSDYLVNIFKVRNISISKTDISPEAPSAVTDIKAIENSNGDLNATVSFRMPTINLAGNNLPDESEITAEITVGDITKSLVGKPGEEMSTIITTQQGNNNIDVTVALGNKVGESKSITVYTGLDKPGIPLNFKGELTEDPYTVNFTWETPNEGAQGKYFKPENLKYSIQYRSGWYIYDVGEIPEDATEFSYTFPEGTPQSNYEFTITAKNEIGEGLPASVTVITGQPYTLPMVEDFTNNRYTYNPFVLTYPSEQYSGSTSIFQAPYYTNEIFEKYDHSCVTAFSTVTGDTKSRLAFPMFSTENITGIATISIEIWNGDLSAEKMTLYGDTFSSEQPIEIGTIEKGTGWTIVNFILPDSLLGQKWCALYLDSDYNAPDTYTMVYSYSISTTSGVNKLDTETGFIQSSKGSVVLYGFEGKEYTIFTLDGRIVKKGLAESDQLCLSLSSGNYIVRAGNKTAKIMVR